MSYRISKKALQDIEDIWDYTLDVWSLEQAERYYNLILDEIEYLSEFPFSGRDCGHIRKNYRCSKVKSHLIFYRFDLKKQGIEVIRLLHERMDIEGRLGE